LREFVCFTLHDEQNIENAINTNQQAINLIAIRQDLLCSNKKRERDEQAKKQTHINKQQQQQPQQQKTTHKQGINQTIARRLDAKPFS
jgi:hypothetical protein